MIQMALLPVAPLLLMPFILLFFVIVFPFWIVALAVLGTLLVISRGIDWVLRLVKSEAMVSAPISNAFHWTLSWGGIAQRRDRPQPPQSS
jgi:hypothetical protein